MRLRLFLLSLLFFSLPASAGAAPPEAEIFLDSPSVEGGTVTATDREFLRYRVEFDAPIDALEAADFDLSAKPAGSWQITNVQKENNGVWTVDVWRSGGDVGSGAITLRLLAESVSRSGETGPAEPVFSPSLRIDFDSPTGAEFDFSDDTKTLAAGPLGSGWYREESWLDARNWIDVASSGSTRMALEKDTLWRSVSGSAWSEVYTDLDLVGVERFSGKWWTLDSSGAIQSSSGGTTWTAASFLPGSPWVDLLEHEGRLWALREDGSLYVSVDGEVWDEQSGSLVGQWLGMQASSSAILLFSSSGDSRKLFRGSWTSGSLPGDIVTWGSGHWWAATSAGSLYRSPTGLDQWQSVALPDALAISDIFFFRGRIYLLRSGGLGASAQSLLHADTDDFSWSSVALPTGSWQQIFADNLEMVLLGEYGAAYSGGELYSVDTPPELLFADFPADGSSWQESITRSWTPLVEGECSGDWTEESSGVSWPSFAPLAEDRCWRYARTVTDAAGNKSTAAFVFTYAVPPDVTEFARSGSGIIGPGDLAAGILYNLRFQEPLKAGDLQLGDLTFGGTAGGSWSGELATTDRKNWTLRVSSANASSGTVWIDLGSMTVRDEAGNPGPLASYRSSVATLDLQAPPTPTWTDAPPATLKTNSISVSFVAGEAGGTLLCSLDNTSPTGSCTSPRSWSGLQEGSHTIRVWHRDDFGNTSDPLVHGFLVDTIPPGTPVLQSSIVDGSKVSTKSASFSWTSSEPTECSWQGGAWQGCTSPQSFSDLSDGSYSFRVRAKDSAGNLSGVATRSWAVDTEAPPTPVIESGPPPVSSSSSATFYWSEEDGADSECRLQDDFSVGAWEPCSSPRTLSFLESGNYVFEIRQKDQAGNLSGTAQWSWQVILSAPPKPRILSGPPEISSSRSATFTFSSSQPHSFQCLLGGSWETCASPYSVSELTDGSRTFQVRQINEAGTAGPAALWSWTVDGTPPARPEVDVRPPLWTSSQGASFAWRSEIGTTSLCQLDDGAWGACSSIWELQNLPEGYRTFRIRAEDAAGNLSDTWEYSWNIDRTDPQAPLWTSGPEGPTDGLESTFAWTGEAGAVFECSLDGQPWDPCTSPKTLRFAVAGEHTFRVRQKDRSGNISAPASRTWSIDLSNPPAPEVIDKPRTWTRSGYASFSWINDSQNSSQCSLDSGPWQKCSSPWETTGLLPGKHSFRVRQVRPSGRSGNPSSVTWGIDQIAPVLSSIRLRPAKKATRVTTKASDAGGSGLLKLWLRPGSSYPVFVRKIYLRRQPREARVCDRAGNCSRWLRIKKARS